MLFSRLGVFVSSRTYVYNYFSENAGIDVDVSGVMACLFYFTAEFHLLRTS